MRNVAAGTSWRDVTSPQSWAAVGSTNANSAVSPATLVSPVAASLAQPASIRAFSPQRSSFFRCYLMGGGTAITVTPAFCIQSNGSTIRELWIRNDLWEADVAWSGHCTANFCGETLEKYGNSPVRKAEYPFEIRRFVTEVWDNVVSRWYIPGVLWSSKNVTFSQHDIVFRENRATCFD
jgi:hypothetical protein